MAARLFSLLACLLALGCGPKGPAVPTFPVTGKITLKGKPLEAAQVNFANKNPDGLSASGMTDGEGRFKLTTYVTSNDLRAGAVSGEYTVLVSKPVPLVTTAMADNEKMRTASDKERQEMMMKQWKMVANEEKKTMNQPKSEVPEKYGNRETSPLKNITVVNGENPPFEWDLTE